ncbi:MAG TPA: prepilin-type N-terminal cleavage/methylation domain-containing protein [Pyrinomonadaceae bacterium]|nr:prepilin-type N-terminal cleavage/methylation domain-containing protein [Pyrinomonadaceae bacterium]
MRQHCNTNVGVDYSQQGAAGFSLIELLLSLVISLIILAAAVAAFSGALRGRDYQSARTDAIVSAQAAINIMTREIGNSGYGLLTNGLVLADSNASRIHFRTNVDNSDLTTSSPNEDVTFFCDGCDADGGSVVRFDASGSGTTSGIINQVSLVQFQYWDYNEITHAVTGPFNQPSLNTGRVTITLTVVLANVNGAPAGAASNVTVRSDVTLRNSPYMLNRY